jgi:hypothetical protein
VRQDGFSKAAPGDEIRLAWTDRDEHQFDQATGQRLETGRDWLRPESRQAS